LKFEIKNFKSGITLIEIIVVIFIITMFSMIIISDFPKMQKEFALSRAAYKLAQDLRKTEDLGLSGLQINDGENPPQLITTIKGYGIYIHLGESQEIYSIYADINYNQGDEIYDDPYPAPRVLCSNVPESTPLSDCIIETTDLSQDNPDLYIKSMENIIGNFTSINFSPPGPQVNIENKCSLDFDCVDSDHSRIGIILGLKSDASAERIIWINTSGLISVQ
jgi:type II secretory pathway pseudopilin PulG